MDWYILFALCWSGLWFIASLLLVRNDIADTAWGLFPIFLGIQTYIFIEQISHLWIISFLGVLIWGTRLAVHIGTRTLAKKEEDARYKKWRNIWKYFYIRSFFQVFLLQSALALVLALPILFAVHQNRFGIVQYAGICIFCFGFIFESIADMQLSRFVKDKKEHKTEQKIMTRGLWEYSRHPNYFGEVTLWWGIFFISFDVSYWQYTIFSPLLITFLITKVSGIPMAEERYEGNAEWEAYKTKTSPFFPFLGGKRTSKK